MSTPRKAVVTGAASGLGLAVVTELIARGGEVVGLDLPGDARAAAVTSAGGQFVACDVSDAAAWRSAATEVATRLGSVSLVALNAGVMTRMPSDPVDDDPVDLVGTAGYRRVMAVNVDGVVFGVQALLPLIEPGGVIAVTASVAGLVPLPFDPFYAMTKSALIGFVRSMAKRLESQEIRINAFCPHGIDTAIVADQLRETMPADRFHPPRDVALSLLAMADEPTSGGTWVAVEPAGSIEQYLVPPPP